MDKISATISIEEQPVPALLLASLELEVELHHRLASTFRLRVATTRGDQGFWRFVEDETLKPWARCSIAVAAGEDRTPLLDGYVTEARMHVDREESGSYLELVGMDASVLMSLEEKTRDWANAKDSDIATVIFGEYGFTPHVEDTAVIHDEAISTIIQHETDIRFLQRLARRNGFECVVRGTDAYFQPSVLDGPALPVLAAHYGQESNLTSFDARWDAARATDVQMSRVDVISKEIETATVSASPQRLLGRDMPLPPPGASALAFVKQAVTPNLEGMQRTCQAEFDEASFFVEARGEVDTSAYGAILEPRRVVPVKGVGGAFSGLYYITSVTHRFKLDGHLQHFTARRNALYPGPADFLAADSLF